jgi:hypothetical protein
MKFFEINNRVLDPVADGCATSICRTWSTLQLIGVAEELASDVAAGVVSEPGSVHGPSELASIDDLPASTVLDDFAFEADAAVVSHWCAVGPDCVLDEVDEDVLSAEDVAGADVGGSSGVVVGAGVVGDSHSAAHASQPVVSASVAQLVTDGGAHDGRESSADMREVSSERVSESAPSGPQRTNRLVTRFTRPRAQQHVAVSTVYSPEANPDHTAGNISKRAWAKSGLSAISLLETDCIVVNWILDAPTFACAPAKKAVVLHRNPSDISDGDIKMVYVVIGTPNIYGQAHLVVWTDRDVSHVPRIEVGNVVVLHVSVSSYAQLVQAPTSNDTSQNPAFNPSPSVTDGSGRAPSALKNWA